MQFEVRHYPLDIVEVKLTPKSQRKIKKIAFWTGYVAGFAVVSGVYGYKHPEIFNKK